MKRIIILIITSMILIVGCSSKPLTNKQLEEVYRKRYEAYEKYIIEEREKALVLLKAQEKEVINEKTNIDSIILDLQEKIDDEDFLDIVSNTKDAYFEKIESLTKKQVNELDDYLNGKLKALEEQYATIEKEKAELLAKQEEEKRLAIISKEQNQSNSTPNNTNIIPTVVNSIIIVNKKHPLPSNYNLGEDSVAGSQIRLMIKDMQNNGYDIHSSYSGFRSYNTQKELYETYVNRDGRANADTYSARPGHSEHQTGLTFDLRHFEGSLVTRNPEVQWIAQNAANYGFIVRYQLGKENITGYQAEPWHLRYIGNEAVNIYNSGLTLEEYLGVEGGDYNY